MSTRRDVTGRRTSYGLAAIRCPACGLRFDAITPHEPPVACSCQWCGHPVHAYAGCAACGRNLEPGQRRNCARCQVALGDRAPEGWGEVEA